MQLAEFQLGLTKLALLSGHLSSSQVSLYGTLVIYCGDYRYLLLPLLKQLPTFNCHKVFGAIQQAVQHSPNYPESHNLHGLVCEARKDYKSAATFYRLARHAISIGSWSIQNSYIRDVSINLARSLSKVNILEISVLVFIKSFDNVKKLNTI